MWAICILLILLIAIAANAAFWLVLPHYGTDVPPWFVIGFNLPTLWMLPSVGGKPALPDPGSKWSPTTAGPFPTVDDSWDHFTGPAGR
jgi:hypothetical protein